MYVLDTCGFDVEDVDTEELGFFSEPVLGSEPVDVLIISNPRE